MTDNRTVLITGAAKRIGRAIALDLATSGWQVGVHYNSSHADAEQTVDDIVNTGGKAVALQADLGNAEDLDGLVGKCSEQLGPPGCLINNASLFEYDTLQSLTPESWATHMDVNLRAPLFLSQSFARNLPEDQPGTIINLLDQRVWKLTPEFFSYTISKAALWTATRTMAQALAPRIRVNAIGPGPTLANSRQSKELFEKQQASTILGRGPELEEICSAVRFILDAPSLTGQMIALDGGQHLAWQTPDIYDYKPKS